MNKWGFRKNMVRQQEKMTREGFGIGGIEKLQGGV